MTIEQLIDGVIDSLHTEFGDGYQYLTDNNEQDLPAPCFIVKVPYAARQLFFDRRYHRDFMVTITYFPTASPVGAVGELEAELNNTADRMLVTMEFITANGHKIHSYDKTAEKSDGCLVFNMSFDLYEIVQNDVELMQHQDTVIIAKE